MGLAKQEGEATRCCSTCDTLSLLILTSVEMFVSQWTKIQHLASSHGSYHRCRFLNISWFNWWFNWSFIQFRSSVLQFCWEPTMSDAALEDGRHGSESQHSLSCFRAVLALGNVKCFSRIQRWEEKDANTMFYMYSRESSRFSNVSQHLWVVECCRWLIAFHLFQSTWAHSACPDSVSLDGTKDLWMGQSKFKSSIRCLGRFH